MSIDSDKTISIIIPVYNEASTIDRLIDNLEQFKASCEIIFVDGGSQDGTSGIIEEKYRLVHSPRKGRSHQMNVGAALATGEILLFLHSDSLLPGDALKRIQEIISRGYNAGCFKIKFQSRSMLMKICGFMSNARVKFRNIAFGDQGIFISKSYFYELGGFPELPIMEDYQLSMNIKAKGDKIALANTKLATSERRFLKNGRLRTMMRMQRLQSMYRKGKSISEIADLYR